MSLKLGSLFSGAGGFEFAAQICGIEPVWASEIEPFPVAVTTKRFPNMKHLGDVTKVNGAEIEPVDIITFGSPCQSVSVAGKREGAKHTGKGDEETTRSGLFYEAIRIIKEMRDATDGIYPRIAVLENVPGFFSSAKGEDWRLVLEAFCRVIDENADVPRPPKGKWANAGEIVANEYSVAWRVLDPRKCVPQRRRRIFLVADFRGERAGEILFKREGLSRNFAESREAWQGITKSLAFGSGDKERNTIDRPAVAAFMGGQGAKARGIAWCDDGTTPTLKSALSGGNTVPDVLIFDTRGNGDGKICSTITGDHENRVMDYTAVVVGVDGYNAAETGEQASTLGVNCGMSTGRQAILCVRERCGCEGGGKGLLVQENVAGSIVGHSDQFLCYAVAAQFAGDRDNPSISTSDKAYCIPANPMSDRGQFVCYAIDQQGGKGGANYTEGVAPTILSDSHGTPHGVCCVALDRAAYNQGQNAQFDPGIDGESGQAFTVIAKGPGAVCYAMATQQGGAEILKDLCPTITAAAGMSGNNQPVTPILTPVEIILRRLTPTECARLQGMPDWWCDDVPHSDSAEYKMWGNGMALPCVLYVMEGVKEILEECENAKTKSQS